MYSMRMWASAMRARSSGSSSAVGLTERARLTIESRSARIADAHIRIEYTKLLNYRALSKILRNEKNWPEVPLAKLQWSYLAQTLAELAVDLLGPSALPQKGQPGAVDGGAWNRLYVFQRYTSIGAGTTEVQKNIIADKALNMGRR